MGRYLSGNKGAGGYIRRSCLLPMGGGMLVWSGGCLLRFLEHAILVSRMEGVCSAVAEKTPPADILNPR